MIYLEGIDFNSNEENHSSTISIQEANRVLNNIDVGALNGLIQDNTIVYVKENSRTGHLCIQRYNSSDSDIKKAKDDIEDEFHIFFPREDIRNKLYSLFHDNPDTILHYTTNDDNIWVEFVIYMENKLRVFLKLIK